MPTPRQIPLRPIALGVLLVALALMALASPAAAGVHRFPKRVAKSAANPILEETILTTTRGFTLYSLREEKRGHFVCDRRCLDKWRPLTVGANTQPKGPVKLGTTRRPDGRIQVTYRGHPLYTFRDDRRAGEVGGDGVEDVGAWHAAAVG